MELKTNYVSVDTSCTVSPLKIGTQYYETFQDAYANAASGSIIEMQAGIHYTDLIFNQFDTEVKLLGGYNCTFDENAGKTRVNGTLGISEGTVTIENLIIW